MNDLAWQLLTEGDTRLQEPAVGEVGPGLPAARKRPGWAALPQGTPGRLVVGAALTGIAFDVAANVSRVGVAFAVTGFAALLTARFAFPAQGRRRHRDAVTLSGLVFAGFLAWRGTGWLQLLDGVALLLAIVLAGEPGLVPGRARLAALAWSCSRPILGVVGVGELGVGSVARAVPTARARFGGAGGSQVGAAAVSVVRGSVIAVPILAILGALLASADALFDSMLRLPGLPDLGSQLADMMVVVVAAVGIGGVAVGGWRHPVGEPRPVGKGRLGAIDALVVFVAVDVLFAAFVVTQIVAIAAGAGYVEERSHLTYAQYARSGFFQLLTVTVLTLVVIGALRALAGRSAFGRPLVVAATATCVLASLIGVVSFRRLWLYERAYGITVDRVVAHAGVLSVLAVLAVVAWGILRSSPDRDLRGLVVWRSLVAVAAIVIVLNVANPAALSARSIVARMDGSQQSLSDLMAIGDDGVPALADALQREEAAASLRRLGADRRSVLAATWCPLLEVDGGGVRLGDASLRSARASLCQKVRAGD